MDQMTYFIFVAALHALKAIIKSPARKAALRDLLLRLRDAITLIYEPETHQGSVNAKIDVAAFVNNAVALHVGHIAANRYDTANLDGFVTAAQPEAAADARGDKDNAST